MSNRVAMVTGGAQGIGKGIAAALAAEGFRVAVADLNLTAAEQTAKEITAAGGTAIAVEIDVTRTAAVESAVKAIEAALGPVEVVVNNAGWDDFMPFVKTTEEFWDKILDINFKGALRVIKAVVPGMMDRGFGRVINIGSDAGRVGSSLEAVYSGAKGGIIAFTKTLAREVAAKGVTANTVCPGPTDTPALRSFAEGSGDAEKVIAGMARAVPMRRLGTPEDIGPAVAFLASDGAGFVTGQTLSVSGGLTRPDDGLSRADRRSTMTAPTQVVTWRRESPGVWVVTLDRPPANALGVPILEGLHAAIDAAERAGDVKVMIVTSALDGFFAAGADIKHMSSIDAESFMAYGDKMRAVNDQLAGAPWVSIAAVDGLALGGGLELAMACTMRVSGPRGRFGLPEVKLGLIPGAGGTQRLPRLVGRGRALDIMLTARQVTADEALAVGLVDRLADGDVVKEALALAAELVTASLPAQLAVVRAVNAAFELPPDEGLRYEALLEQGLFADGEAAEGIRAFIAKRAPDFAREITPRPG